MKRSDIELRQSFHEADQLAVEVESALLRQIHGAPGAALGEPHQRSHILGGEVRAGAGKDPGYLRLVQRPEWELAAARPDSGQKPPGVVTHH